MATVYRVLRDKTEGNRPFVLGVVAVAAKRYGFDASILFVGTFAAATVQVNHDRIGIIHGREEAENDKEQCDTITMTRDGRHNQRHSRRCARWMSFPYGR